VDFFHDIFFWKKEKWEYRITNKDLRFKKFDDTSHRKDKTNIVKLLKSLFNIRYSLFPRIQKYLNSKAPHPEKMGWELCNFSLDLYSMKFWIKKKFGF